MDITQLYITAFFFFFFFLDFFFFGTSMSLVYQRIFYSNSVDVFIPLLDVQCVCVTFFELWK